MMVLLTTEPVWYAMRAAASSACATRFSEGCGLFMDMVGSYGIMKDYAMITAVQWHAELARQQSLVSVRRYLHHDTGSCSRAASTGYGRFFAGAVTAPAAYGGRC